MREHWTLDPQVVFLNHGSFGACPAVVLAEQTRLRAELELEPVQFFARLLAGELDRARETVAAFVGARPDDFLFVRNSTSGVSAVLRSLQLQPGDALLTTDHAYSACRNALDYVARRSGAEALVARIPLPIRGPDDVIEPIVQALTPRVRLALIDHVTSPTGLVFPIAAIVRALRERGVETLVDGAHAPGMLELDVNAIGAGYYVGNFHKWVCAPKGSATLCVREDLHDGLHPAVISHGSRSSGKRARLLDEFDWTGCDDPTSWLCVPAAIDFLRGVVPGGICEVQRRNRALALEARALLCTALGVASPAPATMIGSLAAVPLPRSASPRAPGPDGDPLYRALFDQHGIEVPVFPWPTPGERMLRISAQLYNSTADYQRLVSALAIELARG